MLGATSAATAQDTSKHELKAPDASGLLPGEPSVSIPEVSSLDAWLEDQRFSQEEKPNLRSAATLRASGELRSYSVGTPVRIAGSSSSAKQGQTGDVTIRRNENGTPRLIRGAFAPQVQIPSAASQAPKRVDDSRSDRFTSKSGQRLATRGLEVLTPLARTLRLQNPANELHPIDAWTDGAKTTHVRYQQVYNGLPVWGRELVLHASDAGAPYAVTASHAPTPRLSSTNPMLSKSDAQGAAQQHLSGRGIQATSTARKRSNLPPPLADRHPENESRLVIYAPDAGPARLAHEVRTVTGFFQSHLTIVDATSGEVITSFAEQCMLHGGVHDKTKTASEAHSGPHAAVPPQVCVHPARQPRLWRAHLSMRPART